MAVDDGAGREEGKEYTITKMEMRNDDEVEDEAGDEDVAVSLRCLSE